MSGSTNWEQVYKVQSARIEELERENAALRKEKKLWENAVRGCVEWSNGRECEWGERAEHAFKFLHAAINVARKEGQS